jgi:hypothetical protein
MVRLVRGAWFLGSAIVLFSPDIVTAQAVQLRDASGALAGLYGGSIGFDSAPGLPDCSGPAVRAITANGYTYSLVVACGRIGYGEASPFGAEGSEVVASALRSSQRIAPDRRSSRLEAAAVPRYRAGSFSTPVQQGFGTPRELPFPRCVSSDPLVSLARDAIHRMACSLSYPHFRMIPA